MRIGLIGLAAWATESRHGSRRPESLAVYDLDSERVNRFADRATLASSIAEVAEDRDVVGICVRDDAQVTECLDELLARMTPGSVGPETVRAASKQGRLTGVSVIDAAVTGTRYDEADAPFVFTMTGGDALVVERLRPVIDSFSTDTVHVGPLGPAMALKIVNNLVTLVQIMVAEEAFRLAAMTSVSPGDVSGRHAPQRCINAHDGENRRTDRRRAPGARRAAESRGSGEQRSQGSCSR